MLRGLWFLLQLALTLFLGLLVMLAINIMVDNADDGVKQGLGYFIILLSISGIPVIWRGAATMERPFGVVMRSLRFVAYGTFSLMTLLALLLGLNKDPKFLWAIIPFAAVLVILVKTRPMVGNVEVKCLPDDKKTIGNIEYYATYKDDIDRMEKEFRRLLVEEHYFQPEFVQQQTLKLPEFNNIPTATVWHREKSSAILEAQKVFDNLSAEKEVRYNPHIFSINLDTGEAFPEGYDPHAWRHKLFGYSFADKMIFIPILLGLAPFYYLIGGVVFIGSEMWWYLSNGIALALICYWAVGKYQGIAKKRLRILIGKGSYAGIGYVLLASSFLFFALSLAVYTIAYVPTEGFGAPHKAEYAFEKKGASKSCLVVGDDMYFNKLCLPQKFYDALPDKGRASFTGKKSWFGVTLSDMDPVF